MNTDRYYATPFFQTIEKLVPNTIINAEKYAQMQTAQARTNADTIKQMDVGVYHPDRNYVNLYEYKNGHRFYDMKAMTPLLSASRPYTANLEEIYSRNDMIQQTLNKMVNVSGQMVRNADLPIQNLNDYQIPM